MWLFLKIKYIFDLTKNDFAEDEAACECTTLRKYFTPQVSITQFKTFT